MITITDDIREMISEIGDDVSDARDQLGYADSCCPESDDDLRSCNEAYRFYQPYLRRFRHVLHEWWMTEAEFWHIRNDPKTWEVCRERELAYQREVMAKQCAACDHQMIHPNDTECIQLSSESHEGGLHCMIEWDIMEYNHAQKVKDEEIPF